MDGAVCGHAAAHARAGAAVDAGEPAARLGQDHRHRRDVVALDGAWLTTSSYSHWPDAALLAVKHAGCHLRTWGDGYGYALVATGRCDAMVDPTVERYDVAAMPVILAEAGGRFTSVEGRPGAGGGSGVATNGAVHDELLTLLASRSDPVP